MPKEKYPRDFKDLHLTVASRREPELEQESIENAFLSWLEEEILPLVNKDYSHKDFKEDVRKFLQDRQGEFQEIGKNSLNNREAKRLLTLARLYEKTASLPVGVEVLSELEDFWQELAGFKSMHPEDISPLAERLFSDLAWAVVAKVLARFQQEAEDKVLDKSSYQIYLEKIKDMLPDRQPAIEEWDSRIKSFF